MQATNHLPRQYVTEPWEAKYQLGTPPARPGYPRSTPNQCQKSPHDHDSGGRNLSYRGVKKSNMQEDLAAI